jgi:aldose 1-epimerase
MTGQTLALALALGLAAAAPAAAQQYTAKQNGDVVDLWDTKAQMNVSVVISLSDAWKIQVKGQNLVRTSATLEDFIARPGLNGMPLLAPFANRLDETAFYANGKKYNFDLEQGNVRGPIPSTGFVGGTKDWKLVEFKADAKSAWVTCRLDFFKNPVFMKQFPFAHTITMTYRVSEGALEVNTRLDNMSNEPMPVVIGYHPIYELPDGKLKLIDGHLRADLHPDLIVDVEVLDVTDAEARALQQLFLMPDLPAEVQVETGRQDFLLLLIADEVGLKPEQSLGKVPAESAHHF